MNIYTNAKTLKQLLFSFVIGYLVGLVIMNLNIFGSSPEIAPWLCAVSATFFRLNKIRENNK